MDEKQLPQRPASQTKPDESDDSEKGLRIELDSVTHEEPSGFFYRLMEAIDNNTWPAVMEFGAKLRAVPPRTPRGPRRAPPGMPALSQVISGTYTLSREQVRDMFLEKLQSAGEDGRRAVSWLSMLARLDRPCFFRAATDYFRRTHLSPGADLPESELAALIVDLHELDRELPAALVERLMRSDRAAGESLRSRIVDAVSEPPCAEHLGLLAVQALCDRLSEL